MTIAIFPDPVKITSQPGTLAVPARLSKQLEEPIVDVNEFNRTFAVDPIRVSIAGKEDRIDGIGTEGYVLTIDPSQATVRANGITGCFYGIQSIRWLLHQACMDAGMLADDDLTVEVPCCEIVDYPRFPYRGFMLDEARYFLGMDAVKSVLDWMGLLKLNRFHWHVTEDQGWRLEIAGYPRLTEIGSRRDSTPRFRNRMPLDGKENSDATPHGGFYTRAQVREIVEHAALRHVTIVPEIEMPGHATAALASYPEVRCILPDDLPPGGALVLGHQLDGPDIKVSTRWGVHANIFCAGNPRTIEFLHDVLGEVAAMFPGPIIHVGGDEVPKAQWMCCDRCQQRMADLGLVVEEDLQKAFTAGIVDHLAGLGKTTMLWNEHTDESLASRKDHVICQYWTGTIDKLAGFLERGGRVVMSPSSHVYVDLAYHALPLRKVHEYEPLGEDAVRALGKAAFERAAAGGILGIEAPMWGEVFTSRQQMEHCAFPRVLAVADTCWTPAGRKDHARFMTRLGVALPFLDRLGIAHASIEEADPDEAAIERARQGPDHGHYMSFPLHRGGITPGSAPGSVAPARAGDPASLRGSCVSPSPAALTCPRGRARGTRSRNPRRR